MDSPPRALDVSCPHCRAHYLLPAHLLGPGGARVRCPECTRSFDVPVAPAAPGSAPAAATEAGSASGPAAAPAPPRSHATPRRSTAPTGSPASERSPAAVARAVLAALAEREGEALERSAAEGRLFARFGPALFAAYDEYRRRVRDAGPAPFRAALYERWGVELPEITPRS